MLHRLDLYSCLLVVLAAAANAFFLFLFFFCVAVVENRVSEMLHLPYCAALLLSSLADRQLWTSLFHFPLASEFSFFLRYSLHMLRQREYVVAFHSSARFFFFFSSLCEHSHFLQNEQIHPKLFLIFSLSPPFEKIDSRDLGNKRGKSQKRPKHMHPS